jgi:5-methylcytosine-specific restriction endonuclease McrA
MARKHNTDQDGAAWTEKTKLAIWEKGSPVPNYPSNLWRRDKCGIPMKYLEHGNRESEYGWEIDHINPISNNGTDSISNLQPLNWKNNADKSDKLNWTCPSN